MSIFTSTPLSTFANVRTMYIPSRYIWEVYGKIVWAEMVSALFAEPAALRVLGLDIEWYNKSPPSTLQLATHTHCFVIQLSLLPDRAMPSEVMKLLSDSRCIKSGVGISEDVKKLIKEYSIDVPSVLMIDKFSKHLGLLEGHKSGLKSLTSAFLNYELEKNFKVTISNWELELTKPQIEYAADDAIASCLLGRFIMQEAMTRSLFEQPITCNPSSETNLCKGNEQEHQIKEEEEQQDELELETEYYESDQVQYANTFPPTPSYESACRSLLTSSYSNIYMTLEPDVMCKSNTINTNSNLSSNTFHNREIQLPQKTNYKQQLLKRQQTNEATKQKTEPQEQELLLLPSSESSFSKSEETQKAAATTSELSPEEMAVQHWLTTCLHNINEERKQHNEKKKWKWCKASKAHNKTGESGPVLVVNAEGLPLTYCTYNEAKRYVVLDRIAYVVCDQTVQVENNACTTENNSNSCSDRISYNANNNSVLNVENTSSTVQRGIQHEDHRPRIIRLVSNDAGKQRLCQLHRLGQCQRGSKCLYAHSVDELIVDHYVDEDGYDSYDIDVCNEPCDNNNSASMETSQDDNINRDMSRETKATVLQSHNNDSNNNVMNSINSWSTTKFHVDQPQRQSKCYYYSPYKKQKVWGEKEREKKQKSHNSKVGVEQIHEQKNELVLEPKQSCTSSSLLSSSSSLRSVTPNQRDSVVTENLSNTTKSTPLRCVHCYGDMNIMPHSIIPPSLQRYLPKKCKQSSNNNINKFVPICLSCHRQICALYDNEMAKLYEEASNELECVIDMKRITKCYSVAKLLSRQHTHGFLNDSRIEELKRVLLNEWPYSFVRELATDNYNPSIHSVEDIDDDLIERIASNAPGKVRCAITMKTLVGEDAQRAEAFVEHWVRFAESLKLIDHTTTSHENEYFQVSDKNNSQRNNISVV